MSLAKKIRGSLGSGDELQISAEDQRLLREMFESHCGVTHGLGSPSFLRRRIKPRLDHLGLSSLQDYYRFLKYDERGGKELDLLVDRLTTHETYFFRERTQLELLCDEVIPKVSRLHPREPLRIWSAGCSTGEEVYSLAMLLSGHSALRGRRIELIGTDISRQVLARAREATYSASSFRETSPMEKQRYFVPTPEGRFRVKPEIRRMCSFGQLNLIERERFGLFGRFDLVFCRNVLIYFVHELRPVVVDGFYQVLSNGGFLLLGHSENLLNVSTEFECVHLDRGLVYRKGGGR